MTQMAKRDVLLQTAGPSSNDSPHLIAASKQLVARCGEALAALYLQAQGFKQLESNWRSGRFGEIDLIMRGSDGLLIFVEVKTRRKRPPEPGFPEDGFNAIDWKKRRKVLRTAQSWLAQHQLTNAPARLDALLILFEEFDPNKPDNSSALINPEIIHVPAAFDGG